MTPLYRFILDALAGHGGALSREELLSAIRSDPGASHDLDETWGYERVLANLRQGGFVVFDGEIVRALKRKSGRPL
jgi:hypothetical protein